jgi:hypothetical protein
MKKFLIWIVGAVFALAILGSLLPESDKNSTPGNSDSKAIKPALQCESVPTTIGENIVLGAQDGTGMKPVRAGAFRSPDFEKVYFVALEFSATGIDNQIGVWATNSLTETAGFMSVDGIAQNFTDWAIAETTDAAISPVDPSVQKAIDCLNQ